MNPIEYMPTTQHGSKRQVVCCIALYYAFMIICSTTFERQNMERSLGQLQEDFCGQHGCTQASTPLELD